MSTPAYQPNPLSGLRRQIREHWQEFRPKTVKALKEEGLLEEALDQADRLTKDAYHSAMDKGMSSDQAWELVREEWAFLPPEKPTFNPE